MTEINLSVPPAPIVAAQPVPGPDLGRCFEDAFDVYKRNVLMLVIAGALFDILSLVTLLILAGPMCAGISRMTMRAMEDRTRKVELGDLFFFDYFGRTVGLFFLCLVVALVGLVLLVLPGLFVMTAWMYVFYLVADRGATVGEALDGSWRIVRGPGFWRHLVLGLVTIALTIIPDMIPVVGFVAGWFVTPLSWLLVTSAYLQAKHGGHVPGGKVGFPIVEVPQDGSVPPTAWR